MPLGVCQAGCRWFLLTAWTGCCLLTGCAHSNASAGNWSLPFAKKADEPQVPSPDDRIEELRKLSKLAPKLTPEEREKRAAELVAAVRTENDPLVRAEIFRTLGSLPTLASGSMLYAGLQDSDPEIRIACCQAWGRRDGSDAARVLGDVLRNDEKIDVRLAAARALGEMKDQAAVAALAAGLEDPNPAMQWRSVKSLERVTGKHFGNDVNAWRAFVKGGNPREESLVRRLGHLLY
jgi:HEAT repeat protein